MVTGTTWILIFCLFNHVGNVLIDIIAPGTYPESVIGQNTIVCILVCGLQLEVGYRERRIQFYILFSLLTQDYSIKIISDTTITKNTSSVTEKHRNISSIPLHMLGKLFIGEMAAVAAGDMCVHVHRYTCVFLCVLVCVSQKVSCQVNFWHILWNRDSDWGRELVCLAGLQVKTELTSVCRCWKSGWDAHAYTADTEPSQ